MTEDTLVQETLKRASNLSEVWTGTTVGNIIDSQKRQLEALLEYKDMNLVSIQVLELAQSCDNAEKQLDEY